MRSFLNLIFQERPQVYQLHAENAFVRFERYRKSKTVCVQVTSCPHRAVTKTIPKVSLIWKYKILRVRPHFELQ